MKNEKNWEIEEIENFRKEVLEKLGQKIHKNFYCGSGRHTRKSDDFVSEFCNLAERLGILYKKGNDAPRGGWEGEYLIVSKNQKGKLKRICPANFLLNEKNKRIKQLEKLERSAHILFWDVSRSGNRYYKGKPMSADEKPAEGLIRISKYGNFEKCIKTLNGDLVWHTY